MSQLSEGELPEYDDYLLQSENTLVYASAAYRALLRAYTKAESRYLVARDEVGSVIGVLPAFLHRGMGGAVLNSLPFYGSNGGIIVHSGDEAIKRALLNAFHELSETENCIAATVITSPFDNRPEFYASDPRWTLFDERIAQLSRLPEPDDRLESRLLAQFEEPRPRNIRRAIRSGVVCSVEHDKAALDFLHRVHSENILAVGGKAKPRDFFAEIPRHFSSDQFAVYLARRGGQPVAALLLLYFNRTVEYFTPATIESARNLQPLSLLIFRAMCDAAERRYRWWNWGGTWLAQRGVYDFKRRWGPVERRYYYFTRVLDEAVLARSREELLTEYPNFYIVPFAHLREGARGTVTEVA